MPLPVPLPLAASLLVACSSSSAPTSCTCVPERAPQVAGHDGHRLDEPTLLALVRARQRAVHDGKQGRDLKLLDDDLRLDVAAFCQPCGAWVTDRAPIDTLFPLDRLDDAVGARCLGLALRDGSTAWGTARPPACR